MPLAMAEETSASGEGYYVSGVFNARDLLESIGGVIDYTYHLDDSRPQGYRDNKVFRVTVTVEEV